MKIKAKELSLLLKGEILGDPEVYVSHPGKIEDAGDGAISFLADMKYESFLYSSNASVVLVPNDFVPAQSHKSTLIKVDDVRASLASLLKTFGGEKEDRPMVKEGQVFVHEESTVGEGSYIGPFSSIAKGAHLGGNCTLYANVYIGENVKIGHQVVLHPGVKIYKNCVIGNNVIIHANAVIGSDGFGYSKSNEGSYQKIDQIGNVIIGNDVEIGANACIDRAVMGSTVIGDGVKLDNLVQVAHNVIIDDHTAIAAQAGIAGSTKIGKCVMIGGQAGISGHINISDGVQIQAQSGISKNLKQNSKWYGTPAIEYTNYLKSYAVYKNLPNMAKKLRDIEEQLKQLNDKT